MIKLLRVLPLVLPALALLLAAANAHAATITVGAIADSGSGTLREAVTGAQTMAGADVIEFNLPDSSTITLLSGLPAITEELLIDGRTEPTLTIMATGLTAFTINGSTTTLRDLKLETGNIAVATTAVVAFERSTEGTVAGVISGGGALHKLGSGTLILTGTNTYSGGTTVSEGVLEGNTGSVQGMLALTGATSGVRFNQAVAGTMAGDITGVGSVSKTGVGELVLTGTNTYSGKTTVSQGTLRGGATSVQGDIVNNASVIFEEAVAGTYAGSMSGSGSLEKIGAGTTTMTGTNTYTGGTTVTAGTLKGSATSLQGAIVNNATVVFEQTSSGVYSGAMSGTGMLEKLGTGKLSIDGANSYSGGTLITAGTLEGNTTSLQGDITNNAVLAFNQDTTGTYAGAISGTGTLEKRGAGTLVLTGANALTGLTTVAGGGLRVDGSIAADATVNSGALIGGTGTIGGALLANGTVAPGSSIGTLNVTGSAIFNPGSTLFVEVDDASNSDRIAVGGAATLNGGRVEIAASAGDYTALKTYTILSTTGGITGSFDGLAEDFAFLDESLMVVGNDLRLTLMDNGATLSSVAASENQTAVATALESATPTAELSAVLEEFRVSTQAEVQSGLDSISGDVLGSVATAQLGLKRRFDSTIDSRMRDFARDELPATTAQAQYRMQAAWIGATPPVGARRFGRTGREEGLGGWLEGYGLSGELDGDSNSHGFDHTGAGATLGFDLGFGDHEMAGVSLGYSRVNLDLDAGGDADLSSYRGAVFGVYSAYRFYLGLRLGYALHQTDSTRHIAVGTLRSRAKSDFDGEELFGSLEFGTVSLDLGGFKLQPSATMYFTRLDQDGLAETGAGALNLIVDDQSIDSLIGAFGMRLYRNFEMSGGDTMTPELRLYWDHEFGEVEREIDARIAGAAAGGLFRASGVESSRNSALLGLGYSIQSGENLDLRLDYDLRLNDDWIGHALNLRLSARW